MTVARDERATEPECGRRISRCVEFTELSNGESQMNCKTQGGGKNAIAELAETSMKKSASTCTIHCKIQVGDFSGHNFV